MNSLEEASLPDSNNRLSLFKESFLYYFCLWLVNGVVFIALDFARDIPGLFDGSSSLELIANLFVPFLFIWILAAGFALLSLLIERIGWAKAINFVFIFFFITINIWSFRVIFSVYLRKLTEQTRGYLGIGLFILTLIITVYIVKLAAHRFAWLIRLKNFIFAIILLFTLTTALACVSLNFLILRPATKPSNKTPNIIMVTFDALSANNLKLYGYSRNTAPNIEELAQKSVVFDNFRANFSTTPPALSALQGVLGDAENLVSGKYRHNLFWLLSRIYPNQAFFSRYGPYSYFGQHLPGEYIARSGQKSMLYRALNRVLPTSSLTYFSSLLSRELHTYWPFNSEFADDIFLKKDLVPADLSFNAALDFLEQNPKGSFIWVHAWEPHYPYWPDQDVAYKFGPWSVTPADFINQYYTPEQSSWVEELRNRYDSTIYSVDRKFGKFIEQLKKRGFYDNSIIILGSDHGESHSNGFVGHSGASVVEGITHIPMIIHLPGQKKQTRVASLASQIDLAPTVLELLGLPAVPELSGHSLIPYIDNPNKKDHRVHFTVSYSAFLGQGGFIAIYKDNYKVVYYSLDKSSLSFYDLSKDPRAEVDIIGQHKDLAKKIMKEAGVY